MAVLALVINILNLLILARVVISWLRPDPTNPIVNFIYQATEPILEPIRRILPPSGGVDFSPLVVFVILMFVQRLFLF